MNEADVRVLDHRLANVEEAILEMKDSQKKIGEALFELVRLVDRHESHKEHIEHQLDKINSVDKRLVEVEKEMPTLALLKRGAFAGIGLVLTAAFMLIWQQVTGGGF